jgi:hypothetical protein
MNPAGKFDGFADVGLPELSTGVRAIARFNGLHE